MLSEDDYADLADRELHRLLDALDSVDDERVEAELESGILTIEVEGMSPLIVNSHRAARQIWVAADRHAWHFDWESEVGLWKATKTGEELWEALDGVLVARIPSFPGLRSAR